MLATCHPVSPPQLQEAFDRLWSGNDVAGGGVAPTAEAQVITNLHQLTQALLASHQVIREVDLDVTVCAASRPQVGVLIAQDETGFELLQLGSLNRGLSPGERIRIRHNTCLLRKREMGVELTAAPVVGNDGLHPWTVASGEATLPPAKSRYNWVVQLLAVVRSWCQGRFRRTTPTHCRIQSLARGDHRVWHHQLPARVARRVLRGFLGVDSGFQSAPAIENRRRNEFQLEPQDT
jgi:hypothetical protein